jgi:simple sugar transport system ATP-binding protein
VIPEGGEALLTIEHVAKRFGTLAALDDVSIAIAAGEIHGLLGENGAGKSTLCNIVFGVHRADAGAMRLAGTPYAPSGPADALHAGVAMVHQHFSLVGDLSVVDNLLLGQAHGFLRRRAFSAHVTQLSEEFGLAVRPAARVQDLSVGERQRVEIVKCLMRKPRLLVLDEPTAVLLPEEIDGLFRVCERVAASGCGIVLVTHKLAEIRRIARRVTVLRLGRVVARSEAPAAEIDRLVRAMIGRDPKDVDAAAAVGATPDDAPPCACNRAGTARSGAARRRARPARRRRRAPTRRHRLRSASRRDRRHRRRRGQRPERLVAVLSGMSEPAKAASTSAASR